MRHSPAPTSPWCRPSQSGRCPSQTHPAEEQQCQTPAEIKQPPGPITNWISASEHTSLLQRPHQINLILSVLIRDFTGYLQQLWPGSQRWGRQGWVLPAYQTSSQDSPAPTLKHRVDEKRQISCCFSQRMEIREKICREEYHQF